MRLVAHQPQLFPRLHLLQRWLTADALVFLGGVQFTRKSPDEHGQPAPSGQSSTPILRTDGSVAFLVVPVSANRLAVDDTPLAYDVPWRSTVWRSIVASYGRAARFADLAQSLQTVINGPYVTIGQLNRASFAWCVGALAGDPGLPLATALDVLDVPLRQVTDDAALGLHDNGSRRLMAACSALDADVYVTGRPAVENYLDHDAFERADIKLDVQDWTCPPYPQRWARDFVANLSALDLLLSVGPGAACDVIGL
jgi:hypothetical protein